MRAANLDGNQFRFGHYFCEVATVAEHQAKLGQNFLETRHALSCHCAPCCVFVLAELQALAGAEAAAAAAAFEVARASKNKKVRENTTIQF